MASGEWRVASGEWRVASGEWEEERGFSLCEVYSDDGKFFEWRRDAVVEILRRGLLRMTGRLFFGDGTIEEGFLIAKTPFGMTFFLIWVEEYPGEEKSRSLTSFGMTG